jgi:hypothetical protein
MSAQTIAEHIFRLPDLHWFAETSGDWNPIHVDPVAARRLLAGEVIVHGMFGMLWAMDVHFSTARSCPAGINSSFHRPILLEKPLLLTRETNAQDEVRLAIVQGGEEMATILLIPGGQAIAGTPRNERPPHTDAIERNFSELKGLAGELPVAGETDRMRHAFPHAVKALGLLPVATIMGLSRIVGMHCPGLHSLFAALNLRFEPAMSPLLLTWQVTRHTLAQAPVRISIAGGGLSGRLDAFVRPRATDQPTMADVTGLVANEAFAGQVALVVGGSRGLGELTAKLIAAGGGRVITTFLQGAADAQRVADEITASGKHCRTLKLDVAAPDEAVAALIADGIRPTHIYYFASPHIGRTANKPFDSGLFAGFSRVYVDAFARLAASLAKNMPSGLKIFYPSTVFLDELPREFAEYIAAKAAGEALCRYIGRQMPGVTVLVRRLPRLPTDQTAGLIKQATENPLQVLLGAVNDMQALPN